ncbi:MAG: formylglycine-generating enzyme family protein, partial [Anaerolineae bacterium]
PDINRHQRGEEESYMLTEISYAKYTCKKLIIPVMAQKTTPPISLTTAHYIDFTLPGLTLADLVTAIVDEISITLFPKASDPLVEATARALAVLTEPFAWMSVPTGRVTMVDDYEDAYFGKKGESQVFEVPAFALAKYPITNAQFERFIADNGYTTQAFWTAEGWKLKQEKDWKQPRYWGDSQWNQPDCPVVGVSWFEADAFCVWLSRRTGDNIHLPTEQMWRRAAGGDKGLAYPWGNEWDGERCNNRVSPFASDRTSPVTQYEGKGDSPFGIIDMSGNVWEWCLTDYNTGNQYSNKIANRRVLCGGAWNFNDSIYFRAVYRVGRNPDDWNVYVGLRPARS